MQQNSVQADDEHATHYASRSLIFAFPDPTTTGDKKPVPFDKERPFRARSYEAHLPRENID